MALTPAPRPPHWHWPAGRPAYEAHEATRPRPFDFPIPSWKDRKLLAAALKPVYTAPSAEAAAEALDEFERGLWGQKYPTVVASWRRAWDRVIPFFAFPPAVRRVVYTTNAIESLHSQLRKIIKTRGHFPSDDAATKLVWLALRNITADWGRAAKEWREAMNQFAILYEERFTLPAQASR
jgi:putative transposase